MADLLSLANGLTTKHPLPIKIISSPEVAKEILIDSKTFIKNYQFLHYLSKGRFSTNSPEWEERAKLSQFYFTSATKVLNKEEVNLIYLKHLKGCDVQNESIYNPLINAAVEVASRMFGFKEAIPWPINLIETIRSSLISLQASHLTMVPIELVNQNRLQLEKSYNELTVLWASHAELQAFFNQWSFEAAKNSINDFSPEGELVQNLFAATETTVAAILNTLDCMSRHDDALHLNNRCLDFSEPMIETFIMETLRLYPPVPIVTRTCVKDTRIGDAVFNAGEGFLVSLIAIHRSPAFWSNPDQFQLNRQEFLTKSYPSYAYIPFLAGPRICAGMKLANVELRAGLAAICELFTITPPLWPQKFDYGISLHPSRMLKLTRKSSHV